MKLEYNILWIDNDIQEYINAGEVKNIGSFLEELGFEPNIVTVEDEADLDNFIFLHKYDLIVSDFNLNATTGDIIIEKIRNEKGFSTEILFYTAKSTFRNNPEVKERLAFMDRITFHSNRDTFLDKVEKLIKLTLDKLLELNATRGVITATTSNMDVEIEELVMLLVYEHLKLNEEDIQKIITHYVEDFLKKSPDHFLKKYNEVGFKNWFHRMEANRKWSVFRDLLKKIDSDAVKKFLEQNKKYGVEVIDIRNKFAHAKAEDVQGKMVLKGQFGQDGFQFDTDACIVIRKNLINHKRHIEALKLALAGK
jgi:CheY-like chemotaxis protein